MKRRRWIINVLTLSSNHIYVSGWWMGIGEFMTEVYSIPMVMGGLEWEYYAWGTVIFNFLQSN